MSDRLTPTQKAIRDRGSVMYGGGQPVSDGLFDDLPESNSQETDALRKELEAAKAQLARFEGIPIELALIPVGEDMRELAGFKFTPRSLILPDGLTGKEGIDRLNLVLHFLMDIRTGLQFWFGDLGIEYEKQGVDIDELADYVRVERDTFKGWMRVMKKIPPPMRIGHLEYSYYFELARMPLKLKGRETEMLEKCQKMGLSSREFQQFLIDAARGTKPKKLSKPRPADTLFSKESRPVLGEMRNVYMQARRGDKEALKQLAEKIEQSHAWLDEIARAAGLK